MPVERDGGQSYQLRVGDQAIPIKAISSTRRELAFDLDRLVLLKASAPQALPAGKALPVKVTLENRGSVEMNIPLSLYAENASPSQADKSVIVGPGQTRTVTLDLTAAEGRRPYIILLRAPAAWPERVDLTGKVEAKQEACTNRPIVQTAARQAQQAALSRQTNGDGLLYAAMIGTQAALSSKKVACPLCKLSHFLCCRS